MWRRAASASKRSWLGEAMATTSQNSPFCKAGITFSLPIFAVLKIPHRTFFISFHLCFLYLRLCLVKIDAGLLAYIFQRSHYLLMHGNTIFCSLFKCLPFGVTRYPNFFAMLGPGVSHGLYPFVNTFFESFLVAKSFNIQRTEEMSDPLSHLFVGRRNMNSKGDCKRAPVSAA